MIETNPTPSPLTDELVRRMEREADAGQLPAAYVMRDGAPTWVTVSCEGVLANIQAEVVEPDPRRPGRFRIASV